MHFYLGTHQVNWLGKAGVHLFVSHTRLGPRKALPRAIDWWALDSGGFTELDRHGRWTVTPAEYARAVRRYRDEIGSLAWAAPQDWMCEPKIRAKTGLHIAEHQERTVANYMELRALDPSLPIIPVLQGWTLAQYHGTVELYDQAGVDLRREPVVGLGSVCRRQATAEIGEIVSSLAALGIRLHGFGVKTQGLQRYAGYLESADSMAWSLDARRRGQPLPGHTHVHCGNCLDYALQWRARLHGKLGLCALPVAVAA